MAKNKNKKQGGTGPQKPKISQTKKDKNVFKVADGNRLKKAKQVQSSVKSIKKGPQKSDKLNAQFNNLHKDMVVKKEKPASVPKKKNTKNTHKTKVGIEELASTLNSSSLSMDTK